ncbi:unnamed protein product [Ixodes pacificus]
MASGAKQKRSPGEADNKIGGTSGSKRFRKISACEDDDSQLSSSKCAAPPPMSKIYNSSYRNNKPAELFRKDLISAMKLADSEPLEAETYWPILDTWKQEWERGVQVPVNPDHLPQPLVRVLKKRNRSADFKLPPKRFLRCTHDEFFSNNLHVLTNVSLQAEKTCRYDLDAMDQHWLRIFNDERKAYGLEPLSELAMETLMEDFETQCFEKLQREIRTEQGLGIEYDEDVVCDVCRSPDSEEGNEMVFCDQCDLCVHQACYGITRIPEGSWVCRPCALGIRPPCALCPARGGAMKSTRSGSKWAHVSCALWVPEVSIGCVEKMEPITKISEIPASRWALTCCLCRERMGACIQCSVKACKRAYHVTCAFENSLEMKAIIDENPEDGVKLRSFCPKHSKKTHRKEALSDNSTDPDNRKMATRGSEHAPIRREIEMTSEEKDSARLAKIQAIEAEFYKHVSTKETAEATAADPVVVDFVFNYWKLKRKANHDKPLLTPLKEETDRLDKLEENSLYSRVKMFVHLRQDLERVRNLCYMVTRREKIAKSFLKIKEDIFEQQVRVVMQPGLKLSDREREAVVLAGQSEHLYDRLGSNDPTGPKPCLRLLLDALEGREVADLYGQVRKSLTATPTRLPNPYAKQYVNGLRSRRLSAMLTEGLANEGTAEVVKLEAEAEAVGVAEAAKPTLPTTRCLRNGEVGLQTPSAEVKEEAAESPKTAPSDAAELEPSEEKKPEESTGRRFRNRIENLTGRTRNNHHQAKRLEPPPQPPRLVEEHGDTMRCTRSSSHKPEEPTPRERVVSEQTDPKGSNAEKRAGTDENAPKKRVDHREDVLKGVLRVEPVSPLPPPPRSSPLGGYRIPKKARTPNGVFVQDRRGSSPVSPLHEVPSHCYAAGSDCYTRGQLRHSRRGEAAWERSHLSSLRPVLHRDGAGHAERWNRELDFGASSGGPTVAPPADWGSKSEVKENGSRYSMRFRPKCGKES